MRAIVAKSPEAMSLRASLSKLISSDGQWLPLSNCNGATNATGSRGRKWMPCWGSNVPPVIALWKLNT